jgi:iron complex transport system permease protein
MVVLLTAAIVAPLAGPGVSVETALQTAPWSAEYASPDALIFWGTRVPRVLTAIFTGAALALSGLAFQSVLRNPLAEPYILGISAGAGLGKAAAVLLVGGGISWLGGFTSLVLCFVGALLPLLLLQALAVRTRRLSPATLLLAGVMVNVVLSAWIMLIQTFARTENARQLQLWWLGSLDVVGYRQLLVLLPVLVVASALVISRGRAMNLLSFEPVTASNLGLDVERELRLLLWSGTLLAALAVALAGPIGFVGLLVPHVLQRAFGADNRLLAPLCLSYGALFLLLCDLLGWRAADLLQLLGLNLATRPELPVGVVTALIGGPLFLFLLARATTRGQIRG